MRSVRSAWYHFVRERTPRIDGSASRAFSFLPFTRAQMFLPCSLLCVPTPDTEQKTRRGFTSAMAFAAASVRSYAWREQEASLRPAAEAPRQNKQASHEAKSAPARAGADHAGGSEQDDVQEGPRRSFPDEVNGRGPWSRFQRKAA